MKNIAEDRAAMLDGIGAIRTLPCWKVVCGGSVGASFELSFGKRIPRLVPRFVANRIVDQWEDHGEANLLVWCAWRLDAPAAPITSSDDAPEGIKRGLSSLIDATVEGLEVSAPAWDLTVRFSNGSCLKVFCDHVPSDPSIEVNWELFREERSLHVGPGADFTIGDAPGTGGGGAAENLTCPRKTL